MLEIFGIMQSCILRTRAESLKSYIVFHYRIRLSWSVKMVLQAEAQKLHFCSRQWSLLTILTFSVRGPTDTTVF